MLLFVVVVVALPKQEPKTGRNGETEGESDRSVYRSKQAKREGAQNRSQRMMTIMILMTVFKALPHPPLLQRLESVDHPREEVRLHVVPRPSPDLEARLYHRRRVCPGKLASSREPGLPQLRQIHRRRVKLRVFHQLGVVFSCFVGLSCWFSTCLTFSKFFLTRDETLDESNRCKNRCTKQQISEARTFSGLLKLVSGVWYLSAA